MKYISLFIFVTSFAFSCKHNDAITEKVFRQFDLNKAGLNNLANELLVNPEVDSLFRGEDNFKRKANEFPAAISKQMTALGLVDVVQHYWFCSKKSQKLFIFKTNWIPKDSIFIVYNICDTVETKKRFFIKKMRMPTKFGELDNSWQMIKIVKYKTVKR